MCAGDERIHYTLSDRPTPESSVTEALQHELPGCENDDHIPLSRLEEHAWRVKEIIEDPEEALIRCAEPDPWQEVADWLTMAAGLSEAVIDSGRFSAASMMCKGAAEWDQIRSDQLIAVGTETTRMMFIWSAVERSRKALGLKAPEGISVALSGFLKTNLGPSGAPSHYSCAAEHLRRVVPPGKRTAELRRALRGGNNDVTLGLKAGAKLRNLAAHGVFEVPGFDGPIDELAPQVTLIRLGSRMLVFTLQMLLVADARAKAGGPAIYDRFSGDALPVEQVATHAHELF